MKSIKEDEFEDEYVYEDEEDDEEKPHKKHTALKVFLFLFLVGLTGIMYSRYIGITGFVIHEYKVTNSKVPNSFYGYKIMHISDIHYKVTTTKNELKDMVNEINKSKPDVVVFTGDLLDTSIKYSNDDIKDLYELLNSINSTYKYIITGDEDTSSEYKELVSKLNYKLLDNSYDLIYNNTYDSILIGGISSKWDKTNINDKLEDIYLAQNEYHPNYSVLLMHEPSNIDNIDASNFDLVLAGHTMGGQINLPGIKKLIIPSEDIKYSNNYYKIKNTDMYISTGVGNNQIKARLFNKPSTNLYRLMEK
jgi:hypothetical protein